MIFPVNRNAKETTQAATNKNHHPGKPAETALQQGSFPQQGSTCIEYRLIRAGTIKTVSLSPDTMP
jgi:hypothetical protein